MSTLKRAALLLVFLAMRPLAAQAQAPAVHGHLVYEHLVLSGGGERSQSTPGLVADLSLGLPMGNESVLGNLGLRVGAGEEGQRLAPHLFLRVLGGDETWKTFFDVGLLARLEPSWSAGARMGIGLMRELGRHVGIFVAAGGSAGFGERRHIGFDGGIGFQLRFGSSSHVVYDYVH